MFQTSNFITCFIDGFTSKMKSQSIAYLLKINERKYWILDLDNNNNNNLFFQHNFLIYEWQIKIAQASVDSGENLKLSWAHAINLDELVKQTKGNECLTNYSLGFHPSITGAKGCKRQEWGSCQTTTRVRSRACG